MDTVELLRNVESDDVVRRTFGGILPRDKLPDRIETFPVSFIVNTDSSREEGSHWVAFYLQNEDCGEFFDSYGNSPTSLAEEFEDFLKNNVKNYSYNDKRLQGDFSTVCGQFCLFYLYHRCRGYDIREITRMFHKDADINDVLVNEFVNLQYDDIQRVLDGDYIVNQIVRPFKK